MDMFPKKTKKIRRIYLTNYFLLDIITKLISALPKLLDHMAA